MANNIKTACTNKYNSGVAVGKAAGVSSITIPRIMLYNGREYKGEAYFDLNTSGFTKLTIGSIDTGDSNYGSASVSIVGSSSGSHGTGTSSINANETITFSLNNQGKGGAHSCQINNIVLSK